MSNRKYFILFFLQIFVVWLEYFVINYVLKIWVVGISRNNLLHYIFENIIGKIYFHVLKYCNSFFKRNEYVLEFLRNYFVNFHLLDLFINLNILRNIKISKLLMSLKPSQEKRNSEDRYYNYQLLVLVIIELKIEQSVVQANL